MSIVRGFLRELRRGSVFIARVTRSRRNGRYAYLIPPLDLLGLIEAGPGGRFKTSVGDSYVDYIRDEHSEYKLVVSNRGAQIRFP